MDDTPQFKKASIQTEPSNMHFLEDYIQEQLRQLLTQREEVLRAFIAKYGFEPDRFVQVEQENEYGQRSWYVVRRSDERMAELTRMSAQV